MPIFILDVFADTAGAKQFIDFFCDFLLVYDKTLFFGEIFYPKRLYMTLSCRYYLLSDNNNRPESMEQKTATYPRFFDSLFFTLTFRVFVCLLCRWKSGEFSQVTHTNQSIFCLVHFYVRQLIISMEQKKKNLGNAREKIKTIFWEFILSPLHFKNNPAHACTSYIIYTDSKRSLSEFLINFY